MKRKFNVGCAIFSAIFAGAYFPDGFGFTINFLACILNLWVAGMFESEA